LKTKLLFLTLAMIFLAFPVFAQGPAGGTSNSAWAVPLTSGFSMAIASGLCALGQGKATAGAAEAMARNPGATASIRFALILGLVLIESLALYTFAILFIKVV
jgi:F-type H+-transporting ATPase subunit c